MDVFIPHPRPFLHSQLARARRQTFILEREVGARFSSPEDTILSKLEWYRLGGVVYERQWSDILGVLKVCADELEMDYLRHWARELGIAESLERALREANI